MRFDELTQEGLCQFDSEWIVCNQCGRVLKKSARGHICRPWDIEKFDAFKSRKNDYRRWGPT